MRCGRKRACIIGSTCFILLNVFIVVLLYFLFLTPLIDSGNANNFGKHSDHLVFKPSVYQTFLNFQQSFLPHSCFEVTLPRICLLTQSSVGNLVTYLPDLFHSWNGSIVVVAFAYDQRSFRLLLQFLKHFFTCNVHQLSLCYLSIHLVTSFNHTEDSDSVLSDFSPDCFRTFISEFKERNYELPVAYPANFLRNIALSQSSNCAVVSSIDIDLVPGPLSLANNLDKFLLSQSNDLQKVALVVPVFEFNCTENCQIPGTKFDILSMYRRNVVRPFYQDICFYCHRATNYPRWLRLPIDDLELNIVYDVEWAGVYEPYFFALRNYLPLYDERFVQYGKNRLSQLCEMHLTGWNFAVLDNGYLVHKGFKQTTQFHRLKDSEIATNLRIFNEVKDEYLRKYPHTFRTC